MTDEQLTEVLGELWRAAFWAGRGEPNAAKATPAITRAKERLAAITPAGGVAPSNKIIGGLQEAVRGEFTAVHIRPTDALVKHMVERFLGWRLPEDFHPDDGISFSRTGINGVSYPMPMGTNLLDYTQAEAMVRYLLATSPTRDEAEEEKR